MPLVHVRGTYKHIEMVQVLNKHRKTKRSFGTIVQQKSPGEVGIPKETLSCGSIAAW